MVCRLSQARPNGLLPSAPTVCCLLPPDLRSSFAFTLAGVSGGLLRRRCLLMLGFLRTLHFLRNVFRNRLRLRSSYNPRLAAFHPLSSMWPLNRAHRSLSLLRWSFYLPYWSLNLSHRYLRLSRSRLWRSYLTLVLSLLLLLLFNLLTAPRRLLSCLLLGRLLISYPPRLILASSVFELLPTRGFGLRLLLQSRLSFMVALNSGFLFPALLYLLVV